MKKFKGSIKPMKLPELKMVKMAPAPMWSVKVGEPALQTLYANHYYRLLSVVAAARSGDRILVDLALKNLDEKGDQP